MVTKGTLSSKSIREMIAAGYIKSVGVGHGQPGGIKDDQIQPASLDLTIGSKGYRVKGSFLPRKGEKVADLVEKLGVYPIDLSQPFRLEKNAVYIIELQESLALHEDIYAYTNNKSSTGRVDVQTRVLTDDTPRFDKIVPGYKGPMYLEVISKSFIVELNAGDRLNQVRFFNGDSRLSDLNLAMAYDQYQLFYNKAGQPIPRSEMFIEQGLLMTIDLDLDIVGYYAKNTNEILRMNSPQSHHAEDFFEPLSRPKDGLLILTKGAFYILCSKEYVRVPPQYSVEMCPYDIAAGEFRSHYAGFFDPGFGYGREGEVKGTPGVLEVRGFDDDFILRDGQPVCKIIFDQLVEPVMTVYGVDTVLKSNYADQRGPRLSKHFISG